jgi:hypothetical protein
VEQCSRTGAGRKSADHLNHNWGQLGSMELHALVKRSDGGRMIRYEWVAQLRYFAAVLRRCQQISGPYPVKVALSRYSASPDRCNVYAAG